MNLTDIRKFKVQGKKVLLRADLDGPDDDNLGLSNLAETIKFLLENGVKLVIIGHKGRPGGVIDVKLSLEPVSKRLSRLINKETRFVYDTTGIEAEHEVEKLGPGEIVMLENLRFDGREEGNDPEFAKRLASFGEIYVNECFADSHRVHASIVGIPKFLPHASGLRLLKEVQSLEGVLKNPQHPVVFILGGGKTDKAKYVDSLLDHGDWVLVGGVLPRIVESYCRDDGKICVVAAHLGPSGKDIDETSVSNFSAIISQAGTVVWNGPMGEYEIPEFAHGTELIGAAIASSSAFKVVGGGDTVRALQSFGILDKMDWVSSGGGAMLEFLANGDLPGLMALRIKN